MGDEQPDQRGRKGGGISIIFLSAGLLLLVYVLSTGPVVRYYGKQGKQLPNSAMTFYMPLILLSDNVRPVGKFLDWWVNLWEPHR